MDKKERKENVGFSDQVIAVLRDKNGKVKAQYDSKTIDSKTILNYCPKCGKELKKKSIEAEAWVTCSQCGVIHVEFYASKKKHKCITDAGMAAIAGLILHDVAVEDFDWTAIGTGAVAADHEDTTLGVEEARKAAVGTRVTTVEPNDTAQLVATFVAADGLAGVDNITEVGIFNETPAGDMLMRQVFTAIPCDWDAGDTLEMTVKIQAKQGA